MLASLTVLLPGSGGKPMRQWKLSNHPLGGAGHFLNLGSLVVKELRRRNLRSFPFFVLYRTLGEKLIFGVVIPSRSDPLTWLTRFGR